MMGFYVNEVRLWDIENGMLQATVEHLGNALI